MSVASVSVSGRYDRVSVNEESDDGADRQSAMPMADGGSGGGSSRRMMNGWRGAASPGFCVSWVVPLVCVVLLVLLLFNVCLVVVNTYYTYHMYAAAIASSNFTSTLLPSAWWPSSLSPDSAAPPSSHPQPSSSSSASSSSPFVPDLLVALCHCSVMYGWDEQAAAGAAAAASGGSSGPYRLSASRSWDEWSECGNLLVPRSRVVYGNLTRLPGPDYTWNLPPCAAYDVWIPRPVYRAPVHSVIYSVYNQEAEVLNYLPTVIQHATEPFELVVVFDDCQDATIERVHALLDAVIRSCEQLPPSNGSTLSPLSPPFDSWLRYSAVPGHDSSSVTVPSAPFAGCFNVDLVHVRTLIQPSSVWETSSNNIGMRSAHASSHFLVLVQDDVVLANPGYTSLLAAPLRVFPDRFLGVSARCTHDYFHTVDWEKSAVGRCYRESWAGLGEVTPAERCRVVVRETANRGPICLDHGKLRLLGYLDEYHYYLDDSDHDLFARAYMQHRWLTGYLPVDWASDFDKGSSRRGNKPPLTPGNELYRQERVRRYKQHEGGLEQVRRTAADEQWVGHDAVLPMPGVLYEQCIASVRNYSNEPRWHDRERVEAAMLEIKQARAAAEATKG